MRERIGYLTLFASAGTLVCCALPTLLVALGLGATVTSLLSAAPWIVTISRGKEWVFLGSGLMLALAGYYQLILAPRLAARGPACSPEADRACRKAARTGRILLGVSAGVYLVGLVVAYLLGPLLTWLDR